MNGENTRCRQPQDRERWPEPSGKNDSEDPGLRPEDPVPKLVLSEKWYRSSTFDDEEMEIVMKKAILSLGLITALVVFSTPVWSQTLLEQGFEGAFPPTGWVLAQTGDSSDPGFQLTDGSSPFHNTPHNGTHMAAHNDDNLASAAISWLVTPQLTIDAGTYLHFFETFYYSSDYYDYHGVWISTGSGDPANGDFVELQEIPHTGTTYGVWTGYDIDLGTSYAGQNIYIAFRYVGDYKDEWYIDDVVVDHSVPVELMSFSIE